MSAYSKSRFAILGILTLGPSSGYDIKKFSEEALSHFWHESFGNLYTILKRLLAEKLVTRKTVRQSGKPDRIVYSITREGRLTFRAWLEEPTEREIMRSELLLKVFFGSQMTPDRVSAHLEDYRSRQQSIVETLEGVQRMLDDAEEGPNSLYWRLTVRRGLLMAEARIRWTDECLAELAR